MPIFPFPETWNYIQETQANRKAYWNIAQERKKDAEVYAGGKRLYPRQQVGYRRLIVRGVPQKVDNENFYVVITAFFRKSVLGIYLFEIKRVRRITSFWGNELATVLIAVVCIALLIWVTLYDRKNIKLN